MAYIRTSYVTGPALCVFNTSGKFYTKDPVQVDISPRTFQIDTDAFGPIDTREDSHQVVVTATPCGDWITSLVPELWPYANTAIGATIFGATDQALVINAKDGPIHTVINAAITKMPELYLGTTKTMMGSIEFTGLRGLLAADTLWSAASSLYTIAGTGGAAVFANTAFDTSKILTQAYTGVWGAVAGFTSIKTLDGWTVSFDMSTQDISTDDYGVIDKRLTSVGCMAKCVPIGPTAAQIQLAQLYQDTGAARGKSVGLSANDLVITGADTTTVITLANCRLVSAGYRFGSTVLREGEIGFVGVRKVTSGAQVAMWTLAPAS